MISVTISFSGSELIGIAIGIQNRGIALYDIMESSTKNGSAREVFKYLADMEREHVVAFQSMLAKADKFQFSEVPRVGYAAYYQALIDSAVFTDDLVTSEMTTKVNRDIKAIELAIGAEKDSILFYCETKDIMPQRAQPTVDKIIAEEKSHLTQLSELEKKIADIVDGKLHIAQEGRHKKLVDSVKWTSFSGSNMRAAGKNVLYMTERAVFKLAADGIELVEIAPGFDLEKDVLTQMEFRPSISSNLKEMDGRISRKEMMGLRKDLVGEEFNPAPESIREWGIGDTDQVFNSLSILSETQFE